MLASSKVARLRHLQHELFLEGEFLLGQPAQDEGQCVLGEHVHEVRRIVLLRQHDQGIGVAHLVDEEHQVLLGYFVEEIDAIRERIDPLRIGDQVIQLLVGLLREELDRDLRTDPHHPVRRDEHAGYVRARAELDRHVPHVRERAGAELHDFAVREHPGHVHDVLGMSAVLPGNAREPPGHVIAERGGASHGHRYGRLQGQPLQGKILVGNGIHPGVTDIGLEGDGHPLFVHGKHLVHPLQIDQDPSPLGQGGSSVIEAGGIRDDRNPVLVGDPHDRLHLFRGGGQYDQVRPFAYPGREIPEVAGQDRRIVTHPLGAQGFDQLVAHFRKRVYRKAVLESLFVCVHHVCVSPFCHSRRHPHPVPLPQGRGNAIHTPIKAPRSRVAAGQRPG